MKPIIPEAALSQHIAVLGKTRSGKSSVMRGLVEGLLEHQLPVCIVDPKGDWWGIKLAKDGKRPGYPVVIFGGEHADVPINAHAGAHVAELFATGNRPCLIDLGGWMVGERTRFWIEFASTLFRLTKGTRWLVVDEIHNFAPKGKVMDPDAGKALHWTNRLASEGLGKGLPMIFASQRPQKVHNDTLTSAETLIAMRVLHPSDRAAVSDWIKGCGDLVLGNQVLNSLAQMDRGEGWAWSPEIGFGPIKVKFPMFKTYDSFRPQSVEDTKGLHGWAHVDLEDVKAKLADVVQEAAKNDPKVLRARIAELEKLLASGGGDGQLAEPDPEDLAQERRTGYLEGRAEGNRTVEAIKQNVKEALERIGMPEPTYKVDSVLVPPEPRARVASVPTAPRQREVAPALTERQRQTRPPFGSKPSGSGLSKAERLLLTALAQNHPKALEQDQLAILAGYAPSTGHFNNNVGALRTKEFVTKGWPIEITVGGREALGAFERLPTGKALLDWWCAKLAKAERAILLSAAQVYPSSIAKDDLAKLAGYEPGTGHFNNSLGRLRTLQLLHGRREIKASENLF